MTDVSTVNPLVGMVMFFIITTLYFVFKYNEKDTSKHMVFLGIYLTLLIIGEYIINMTLTDSMCGSRQWNTVLFVTLIPWILIFGVLNLCLNLYPGWLMPFSNTFGYFAARLSGFNDTLDKILKPEMDIGSSNDPDQKAIAQALEKMFIDKSLIINEITPANFDTFWTKMKIFMKNGVYSDNSENGLKEKLRSIIRLKDIIAEYIWYLLTGGLVSTIGYNYIVNAGCSQSVQNMKSTTADYQEKTKKTFKEEQQNTPRVYNMTE